MVSKRERSEIGRMLASLRTKVQVRCLHCRAEVTGTKKRKYCSNRCRVAACRQRNAQ